MAKGRLALRRSDPDAPVKRGGRSQFRVRLLFYYASAWTTDYMREPVSALRFPARPDPRKNDFGGLENVLRIAEAPFCRKSALQLPLDAGP